MSATCEHLDSIELTELPERIAGYLDNMPGGQRTVTRPGSQLIGRVL